MVLTFLYKNPKHPLKLKGIDHTHRVFSPLVFFFFYFYVSKLNGEKLNLIITKVENT